MSEAKKSSKQDAIREAVAGIEKTYGQGAIMRLGERAVEPVAVIPTGLIGLTVYKAIKGYLLGNVSVVLGALVIGGIALILFERFRATHADEGEVDFSQITYKRALLIGLFVAFATDFILVAVGA